MDRAILFFLGAREVRSGDQPQYFEAASQEAYKLSLPQPKIFVYEGSLERGFILQNRNQLSLVLSRSFLTKMNLPELSGVCFSLLLQAKKKLVHKRTKAMFITGTISWVFNNFASLVAVVVPEKNSKKVIHAVFDFFLIPGLRLIFDVILGKSYFRQFSTYLNEYPNDYNSLQVAGMKLERCSEIYSFPSRRIYEFSVSTRRNSYKNILFLELLPHEWDYLFLKQDLMSAAKN
jgi:hypothetical protein